MSINNRLTKEFDTAGELDSPETVAAYFRTEHWKELSRITLARDRNRCYTCGSLHDLDVYHITFERLFDEHYDDLATLCPRCKREMEVFKSERNCSLKKAFGLLCKRRNRRSIR
jgi:hypothetical protein